MPKALVFALFGIEISLAAFEVPAENAEIGNGTHEAIKSRFEDKGRQWPVIGLWRQQELDLLAGFVGLCHAAVRGRRDVYNQRFEERECPDVQFARRHKNGDGLQVGVAGRKAHPIAHFVKSEFLGLKIFVNQFVGGFGSRFD